MGAVTRTLVAVVVVVGVVGWNAANASSVLSGGGGASRSKREQGVAGTETTTNGDSETTTGASLPCTDRGDCGALPNSDCDDKEKVCKCASPYDVYDPENSYCGKIAYLDATCKYTSECMASNDYSLCSDDKLCVCGPGFVLDELPELGLTCIATENREGPGAVDSAMIGVLAGLALMFVIICVVLRLFSKARFRENRSIFNTPNPRLMNASLFKDSKLLSPARGDRRGSRASVRVPSRAASVTSVNAASRSPNGSLAKGRRGSILSTASATGSTHHASARPPAAKTPSPVRENKKAETTVAIETVD